MNYIYNVKGTYTKDNSPSYTYKWTVVFNNIEDTGGALYLKVRRTTTFMPTQDVGYDVQQNDFVITNTLVSESSTEANEEENTHYAILTCERLDDTNAYNTPKTFTVTVSGFEWISDKFKAAFETAIAGINPLKTIDFNKIKVKSATFVW